MVSDLIRTLEQCKLLLASDPVLPSVATLVAGEPVHGSWWAHPKSHAIFAAISALSHHRQALVVPFVAGKVTFVHRALWPAFLAVAQSGESWQLGGLSRPARLLISKLQKAGTLEASGDVAREIERRLLARSHEVHTERGSHAKRLERWALWAERSGVSPVSDVAEAKARLERAVAALGSEAATRGRLLPWQQARRRA
jgi:hypothetical protein